MSETCFMKRRAALGAALALPLVMMVGCGQVGVSGPPAGLKPFLGVWMRQASETRRVFITLEHEGEDRVSVFLHFSADHDPVVRRGLRYNDGRLWFTQTPEMGGNTFAFIRFENDTLVLLEGGSNLRYVRYNGTPPGGRPPRPPQ